MTPTTFEDELFKAVDERNQDQVSQIIKDNPDLNLNCVDKDELTPLQHACHNGELEIAKILVDSGADVNYTKRKDGYTALMFAAISNKQSMVRFLLEKGVDVHVENCVNRTASQMAAFIGLFKIVHIVNSWIPYEKSVEPYTRTRELETEPRIPSKNLGKLLHEFIVLPTLHPVKFISFIEANPHLIEYGANFVYVLENLCSKMTKPPQVEEVISLKYHYLSYILKHCISKYKSSELRESHIEDDFDRDACSKVLQAVIRRLVKRDNPGDVQPATPQINRFVLDCAMKFPYTHLGIFKTMTFAMNKETSEHYNIFTQSLNGPHMFGRATEACSICTEVDECKKCSNCKAIYYCSRRCQLIDWFQHKRVCNLKGKMTGDE